MITVFNRKELLSTYSMEAQARAREVLTRNGIDYVVNTKDYSARSRSAGRFVSGRDTSCEYCIYVKRKDYEIASGILEGKLQGK